MNFGNIRSAVVSRLVRLSGFDFGNSTKRCLVYLNGSFYGIFDMQQNYSCYNLAKRYGLDNTDFIEKIKGNESDVFKQAGLNVYLEMDLNDSVNRQILEQYVDMENYLEYCAVNILWNNTDWPGNNFEIWRYTGKHKADNKYSDGRYRFLIYDVDMVYNTDESFNFFEGCMEDNFVSIMENRHFGSGSMFPNVMKSSYYCDKFVAIVCDLLNTSFKNENILSVIQEENQKIATIRNMYYDRNYVERTENSIGQIIRAVQERPNKIQEDFLYYFGLYEKYYMELHVARGINVRWNNMSIFGDEDYSNQYYCGTELVLNQEAYPGYTFQYWLVNGEKIFDSALVITDELVNDGKLYIEAVSYINKTPEIIISEISAKGYEDWIRITNGGGKGEELKNYYISDDRKKLMKYQLPDIYLEPGSSIIIDGDNNYNSMGNYICNFSLKENETLFLSRQLRCIFQIQIPRMSENETYGRYNGSNIWVFMDDESGSRSEIIDNENGKNCKTVYE